MMKGAEAPHFCETGRDGFFDEIRIAHCEIVVYPSSIAPLP